MNVKKWWSSLSSKQRKVGIGVAAAALALVGGGLWFLEGQSQPRFTIQRGESLVQYIGYEDAVRTADRFGLPIYMGSPTNPRASIISMETALATDTDYLQVMVPVYAGDRFDLRRYGGGFVPAPGSPSLDARNRPGLRGRA